MSARASFCVVLFGIVVAWTAQTSMALSASVETGQTETATSPEKLLTPEAVEENERADVLDDAELCQRAPCEELACDLECCEDTCSNAISCSNRFSWFNEVEQFDSVWDSPDFFRKNQWFIQSWIEQGITFNSHSPTSRSNGPIGFNDRSNDYEMNQLYLTMGREAIADGCRWDLGGQVDLLYGTDYIYAEATGLETRTNGTQRWNPNIGPRTTATGPAALYGLSMPQLFAEITAPWGNGFSAKFGHFYNILGYEWVPATQNFFYSHSYSMIYAQPQTQTGMLFTYKLRPNLHLISGMTRGWNTWEKTDQSSLSYLGQVRWNSWDERTTAKFGILTGEEQRSLIDTMIHNRTIFSMVIEKKLGCRWKYVLENDFGLQSHGTIGGSLIAPRAETAHWYSMVNYLFFRASPTTTWGARFEWFRDEDNSRILQLPANYLATGSNYYELTFGMNWKPNSRFVLRPEVRWDWSDVKPVLSDGVYNDFQSEEQFTFAVDAIYTF